MAHTNELISQYIKVHIPVGQHMQFTDVTNERPIEIYSSQGNHIGDASGTVVISGTDGFVRVPMEKWLLWQRNTAQAKAERQEAAR